MNDYQFSEYTTRAFSELSTKELYAILRLRAMVFIVEQECPYQDPDDLDEEALHITKYDPADTLIAYCRIIPPGRKYDSEVCISRVLTHPAFRRGEHGRQLMHYTLRECRHLYPAHAVKISAQLYLKDFYESFGFRQMSDVYLEDNIPHIAMIIE